MKEPATDREAGARSRRRGVASLGRSGDTLGLVWVHGAFHAAVYRRMTRLAAWASPVPVRTLEDFAAVLDEAIGATDFGGTEVFLILGHEEFVHQLESAPAFSEAAARAYLRGRVDRFEKDHEPVLWVAQRAGTARQEASFILHLLPRRFYDELNQILRDRRLDLTRVLPLLVPLQLHMATLGEAADRVILYAAEAGNATALVVGRGDGQVRLTRTTLASWRDEAGRVAVEINRSLLYAKQQFATAIERVWMIGESAEAARAEVEAKCGGGKHMSIGSGGAGTWLESVARLSPRHPVNLVAGYLRRKRRNRFLRRVAIAACWLALALLGFDAWNQEQGWQAETQRLASLQADEPALLAERDRLVQRNAEVERDRAAIAAIVEGRLPPVADRFLVYLASVLPREARVKAFSVKWDETEDRWTFQLDGMIEADEETARLALAGVRKQLAEGPLRVRLVESARVLSTVTTTNGPALQNFTLEGGLFAN